MSRNVTWLLLVEIITVLSEYFGGSEHWVLFYLMTVY